MRTRFLCACGVVAALGIGESFAETSVESASFDLTAENASENKDVLTNGIVLQNGNFSARLRSQFNLWGGYVQDDALLVNGDKMQEPGFRLRRARLALEGQLIKTVEYQIMADLYDQEHGGAPLYYAWLSWSPFKQLELKAGLQNVPFSMGNTISSSKLAHLDRAVGVHAMAPDTGAGLTIRSKFCDYASVTAGVFNGFQRSSYFQEGYTNVGGSKGNRFERMGYVAHLDVYPLGEEVGAEEADLHKDSNVRLALGGSFMFNDGESIDTMGYSGYLHLKAYGFHLFGEALLDHAEPEKTPTTTSTIESEIDRKFFQVGLGYMILKDKLGLAVRGELIDANDNYDDEQDELILAGTLTWYERGDSLKVMLEYQHREERYGHSIKNDHVLAGAQFAF